MHDGVQCHPVAELLQTREAASGGAEEDLHDRDTHLVTSASEYTLSINDNNRCKFRGYCNGESSGSFPKGIFPVVAWENVTSTLPGVAIFASMMIFR